MEKKGRDEIKEGLKALIKRTARITKEVVDGFKKGYKETAKKGKRRDG